MLASMFNFGKAIVRKRMQWSNQKLPQRFAPFPFSPSCITPTAARPEQPKNDLWRSFGNSTTDLSQNSVRKAACHPSPALRDNGRMNYSDITAIAQG